MSYRYGLSFSYCTSLPRLPMENRYRSADADWPFLFAVKKTSRASFNTIKKQEQVKKQRTPVENLLGWT
jgi:hypothetical protein